MLQHIGFWSCQRMIRIFIILFLSTAHSYGQSKEYKLIQKGSYEKAEKAITRTIEKDSMDVAALYCAGIIKSQKASSYFDPKSSYDHFLRAITSYYRLEEKSREKLEKDWLTLDSINYYLNICLDHGLDEAIALNTIVSYQGYIDYFSRAQSQQKIAIKKRNELAFQVATEENTEEAYTYFLSTYPNSLQYVDAIKGRDNCAFIAAKENESSDAILAFLKKYPKTRLRKEANLEKNRLFYLEQTDGSLSSYISFCDANERSEYFSRAADSIEVMSLRSLSISGLTYLCRNEDYVGNYSKFQDELFKAILFDGHRATFRFFNDQFVEYLDEQHTSKFYRLGSEINETEDLFLSLGVTEHNYYDYISFIKELAPLDMAWVALQRLIELDVRNSNWDNVLKILGEYHPYFQKKSENKVSELMAIIKEQKRNILIHGMSSVNTENDEYAPVPSIDGMKLFFCGKDRFDNLGGEDIFEVNINQSRSTKAKIIQSLSTEYSNEAPLAISADGNSMLLWTSENGGDLQRSIRLSDGGWSNPMSFESPINSPYYEGDAMLSADGKALFFTSTRPGGRNFYTENNFHYFGDDNYPTDIYVCNLKTDGTWSEPINLGKKINTSYSERTPYLHPDGKTLYFSSEGHPGLGRLDVFKTTRLTNDSWSNWSTPQNMGKEINGETNDWGFKFSTDGKTVYYAAKEKEIEKSSLILLLDVSGSMDGYKLNDMIKAAKEVCLNALGDNSEVAVLPFSGECYEPIYNIRYFTNDAKELHHFIGDLRAQGATPMYEALEVAAEYMKNYATGTNKSIILMSDGDATSCDDLAPTIRRINKNYGKCKVYTIALEVDESSTAYKDLSYIAQSTGGSFFHAVSSDDLGKVFAQASTQIFNFALNKANSEIYKFTLPEDLRPEIVSTISGVLSTSKSEPIEANVYWEDLSTGKNMGVARSSPVDGSYFIVLPNGRNYGYFVDDENYFPSSNNVDLTNAKSMSEIKVDVEVVSFEEMINENKSVKINNIFFETAKHDLKKESYAELRRVLLILKKYPEYSIIVEGHTDNVGNSDYNMQLSERRANAVVKHLIAEGIDSQIISSKGYGFTKPVTDNSNAVNKALNRRVELKLVKK